MLDGAALAAFAAAALAVNLTPGPDMLLVAARSMGQGRRAGLAAASGIFVGCIVHILAAAFGLAALLALAPGAYLAIKYLGAAYLLWIGARLLRGGGSEDTLAAAPDAPLWTIFRQGVVTNVLNPKVALFFLAFLPQFAGTENAAAQMIALGMFFNLGGILVNGGVALGLGAAGDWLRQRPRVRRWQERISGVVFIAVACRLALPDRG